MSSSRRLALMLLLSWVMLFCMGRAGAAMPVLIVTSDRGGAYAETIEALRVGLVTEGSSGGVVDIDWQDFDDAMLDTTHIIVTVGSQAAHAVNARPSAIPVLNILLPRAAFEALPNDANANSSAIFLDQPTTRQIAAIAQALPGWKQLALIAGPETGVLAAELADSARAAGFEVVSTTIASERELYSAMQRTLSTPTILLAVPDRQIFNSHTIQNILLTSYRQRSPLVGFSPAYVGAGALLAVYSTPTQIGAQAAEAVRAVMRGVGLPPPGYPTQFDIGVNVTVARSLGIHVDAPEAIAARIRRLEQGR
jgi:putative tryptophan/tyrosine transport system substrate-binding protein